MFNWVSLLLRIVYYYSHIIGVSNFVFDWRTGQVFRTTWSTLYAATINVIIAILFGFKLTDNTPMIKIGIRTNMLYNNVVRIVSLVRLTAVLVTLLNRWRQRSQLMTLTRNILHHFLAWPQVIRMSRWRIMLKFLNGIIQDILQLVIAFKTFRRANTTCFLWICLDFWTSAILNLAIAQPFYVMLCIRTQYQLINMELRQIVEESNNLSHRPPRKGALMTRCCSLADQLEDLANFQSQLQSIVNQLNRVFGIQYLMVYSGYYLSAMLTAYTSYVTFKNSTETFAINLSDFILSLAWCYFYYVDSINILFMAIQVQDDHKEMIRILEERTLFAPGLDARLEEAFESFQLQLIRDPFKMEVLKLFSATRNSMWSMVASLILHSIYLVQYDVENF